MVVNPAGFVAVFDRGAPFIITGKARQGITGGQLVFSSGAADVVSSGANSFDTPDIAFASAASGANFTGVAINTVGSNGYVSVLIEGAVISTADGTVTAGTTVVANGADSIQTGTAAGTVVGRALTTASSGGYALWKIGF